MVAHAFSPSLGCRVRWISVSFRSAWYWGLDPGQLKPHQETLSGKPKTNQTQNQRHAAFLPKRTAARRWLGRRKSLLLEDQSRAGTFPTGRDVTSSDHSASRCPSLWSPSHLGKRTGMSGARKPERSNWRPESRPGATEDVPTFVGNVEVLAPRRAHRRCRLFNSLNAPWPSRAQGRERPPANLSSHRVEVVGWIRTLTPRSRFSSREGGSKFKSTGSGVPALRGTAPCFLN